MPSSSPLTLRPSPLCERYVSHESRRRRRSRSEIVRELTDEAIKSRMFPGITFHGDRRRAAVTPRWEVWQVVKAVRDYGSVEAVAMDLGLEEDKITLALSYYESFKDEIDQELEAAEMSVEQLRVVAPHAEVVRST